MPYAIRNSKGHIIALLNEPAVGADEFVSADHPDVGAFLNHDEDLDPKFALAESDKEIARVTEDLIHLLVAKNVILFTELPDPVQRKLLNREKLRSSLHGAIDNFLDEDEYF
ncbi:hypothetical protein KOI40_17870 [Aestuariicella sp. G3-2]|uniref:hypothetical protein n=1 Tax=Pseudomaricurvus albidus TaxID=2842452 RepID=UPI001C0DE62E|nr:hypothetical protein [Aestuariicella albida]MBU3071698.1 hypothetical protein [Aestuariicella albida]